MSKSANRRVFRRHTDPDQAPIEPKRRWWRRRRDVSDQAGGGESSTLSPTSANHPASSGFPLLDPRSTRRQRVQRIRLREQRAQGNRIREWLQQRMVEADKKREKARKAKAGDPVSRGVDRVPAHLRVGYTLEVPPPLPDPVEYREVRGRHVRAPYRNPERAARLAKSGRLRAELREDGAA